MVRLKTIIQDGWPINRSEVPLDLMVYYHIRDELAFLRKGYPELVIPSSQGWGIGLQSRALTPFFFFFFFFLFRFSMIFLSPHFGQITIFRNLAM